MEHLKDIRDGKKLNIKESVSMIISLSLPIILAQLSTIAMQYIDSSMVGHLNTGASASIGLVTSSTWLLAGVMRAMAIGFSVQLAHRIGAKEDREARNIMIYGTFTVLAISLIFMGFAASISSKLPIWLGGQGDIAKNSSSYFLIFALALPFFSLNFAGAAFLQSSGNMKIPSLLNILKCILDVIFNFFLIYPTRKINFFGYDFTAPGLDLGVKGAALGTAFAELTALCFMLYFLFFKSETLKLRKEKFILRFKDILKKSFKISIPVALETLVMTSAQISITRMVAPLGTVAIAANSFAITAEGIAYMPGYGIGAASTTIIGQSLGARQEKTAKSLAWLTLGLGMILMSFMGLLMFIFAPNIIGFLSPSPEVIALGSSILRIEVLAEPMFAASIVISGIFRGYGDTLVPGIMNLVSMWFVRIPLALLLVKNHSLKGIWMAMAIELTFRGTIFIVRLFTKTRNVK
ncbi:MATE family efflux transporter [Peptoniphilaceae bacterium SGI.131]